MVTPLGCIFYKALHFLFKQERQHCLAWIPFGSTCSSILCIALSLSRLLLRSCLPSEGRQGRAASSPASSPFPDWEQWDLKCQGGENPLYNPHAHSQLSETWWPFPRDPLVYSQCLNCLCFSRLGSDLFNSKADCFWEDKFFKFLWLTVSKSSCHKSPLLSPWQALACSLPVWVRPKARDSGTAVLKVILNCQ